MRKGLALLTAVILAFTCLAAGAESQEDKTLEAYEIEEKLVSGEGKAFDGTLAGTLDLVSKFITDPEYMHILRIKDVQDIMNEVVLRGLVWLWQNRPVTMKVLKELGVKKEERSLISTIWDSAERLEAAEKDYILTEDGQQLKAEFEELKKHPACDGIVKGFFNVISAQNVRELLDALHRDEGDTQEAYEPVTTDEVRDYAKQMGYEEQMTDADAEYLAHLVEVVQHLYGAESALGELMTTEIFWKTLLHLYISHFSDTGVIREEVDKLLSDRKIREYISNLSESVAAIIRRAEKKLAEESAETAAPGTGEGTETEAGEVTNP